MTIFDEKQKSLIYNNPLLFKPLIFVAAPVCLGVSLGVAAKELTNHFTDTDAYSNVIGLGVGGAVAVLAFFIARSAVRHDVARLEQRDMTHAY